MNANHIPAGQYARKQILSRSAIIAWSHGRRFQMARRLVLPFRGRPLLDYGCGDGTFLSLVAREFPEAVGADLDAKQLEDCAQRFLGFPNLSFMRTDALDARYSHRFAVVTCMEVLEHCTHETVMHALAELDRLVAPKGALVVSVPIEVGPALLAKQILRRVAGWRRLGDYAYAERYRFREFLTMFFAGDKTAIERVPYSFEVSPGKTVLNYGHKGFNWRALRARLRERFRVSRTLFTPVDILDGALASQAWFVCTRY